MRGSNTCIKLSLIPQGLFAIMHTSLTKAETRVLKLIFKILSYSLNYRSLVEYNNHFKEYRDLKLDLLITHLTDLGYLASKLSSNGNIMKYKKVRYFSKLITMSSELHLELPLIDEIIIVQSIDTIEETSNVNTNVHTPGARLVHFSGNTTEAKRLQRLLTEQDNLYRKDRKEAERKAKISPSSTFDSIPE